jgi:hypothetical protein
MSATVTVGRTRKYHTPEEKSEAQRHNALLHYHRKKALTKAVQELAAAGNLTNGDVITVHVSITSRALGPYSEDIYYRIVNKDQGVYQKISRETAENL